MMAICSNPVFSWQSTQQAMHKTKGNRQKHPAGINRLSHRDKPQSIHHNLIHNEGSQS